MEPAVNYAEHIELSEPLENQSQIQDSQSEGQDADQDTVMSELRAEYPLIVSQEDSRQAVANYHSSAKFEPVTGLNITS